MNKSQYETFLTALWLGLGIAERRFRHGNIVADIAELDRRAFVLRVDRRPAIELKAARRRAAAQEHELNGAILRRVAGAHADYAWVLARHDLCPALKVG